MEQSNLKVIVTGTTGMVGEGVLHLCLADPSVSEVLVVSRRASGLKHPKLKEILHTDFLDMRPLAGQLSGYDACLFCLGVSSVGLTEADYTRLTYDLTLGFAKVLADVQPNMTFCYISGSGTDSTEKGRLMWARVKGKTENDLRQLPFKAAHAFRPGYLHPMPNMTYTHKYYKYITWLYPIIRLFPPVFASSLEELGVAMLEVVKKPRPSAVYEVKDIVRLAREAHKKA